MVVSKRIARCVYVMCGEGQGKSNTRHTYSLPLNERHLEKRFDVYSCTTGMAHTRIIPCAEETEANELKMLSYAEPPLCDIIKVE